MRLPRSAWPFVLVVSLLRLVAASRFPLTGDEAYYWMWSRHLAFGYVDHPPMVAWLIALTAPLGAQPGFVRLPFVVCEAVAAFAAGAAAERLARDPRAGAAAAIAFTLVPQTKLAFAAASPDGPFSACWALSVYLLARMERAPPSRRLLVALGAALGGALLSRAFGWALVFGVAAYACGRDRSALRARLWIAFAIAAALYAPFVYWNATHGWANVGFTLHDRQPFEPFALRRAAVLSTARLLVVAALMWLAAFFVALRPRRPLLAWTALPLPTVLAAISLSYPVESYWVLGPATALCAGIGIEFRTWSRRVRGMLLALAGGGFAYVTLAALFVALPEGAQARLLRPGSGALRGALYSGAFAYAPLAHTIGALATARHAGVLTDRNEIAAELTYEGLHPFLVGPAQARQWREWRTAPPQVSRVLFISYAPLQTATGEGNAVARAFRLLMPGPTLQPRFAGFVADSFYTLWCDDARADAAATLFDKAAVARTAR